MDGQLLLLPPSPPSSHPVDVGQRTEAIVLAELVKRGHRVLIPFGVNHRYDLMLDLGEKFVRVQCKTARIEGSCVQFNCQSVRSNTKKVLCRDYRGDADLFIAYCPQNDRVYAVPVDEAARTQINLRLDPPANNQKVGVRWATDYELPA
jgi:PD-(D/E)XK nuclease superfamily protein